MINKGDSTGAGCDYRRKDIKEERRAVIKEARDRARNIRRATEDIEGRCIVCGKEIKKGQPIRTLPRDRNCREVRLYHQRTCSPGSENWKAFKANGKKTPQSPLQWRQLSFEWSLQTSRPT
jgi:hypothetical protein